MHSEYNPNVYVYAFIPVVFVDNIECSCRGQMLCSLPNRKTYLGLLLPSDTLKEHHNSQIQVTIQKNDLRSLIEFRIGELSINKWHAWVQSIALTCKHVWSQLTWHAMTPFLQHHWTIAQMETSAWNEAAKNRTLQCSRRKLHWPVVSWFLATWTKLISGWTSLWDISSSCSRHCKTQSSSKQEKHELHAIRLVDPRL